MKILKTIGFIPLSILCALLAVMLVNAIITIDILVHDLWYNVDSGRDRIFFKRLLEGPVIVFCLNYVTRRMYVPGVKIWPWILYAFSVSLIVVAIIAPNSSWVTILFEDVTLIASISVSAFLYQKNNCRFDL